MSKLALMPSTFGKAGSVPRHQESGSSRLCSCLRLRRQTSPDQIRRRVVADGSLRERKKSLGGLASAREAIDVETRAHAAGQVDAKDCDGRGQQLISRASTWERKPEAGRPGTDVPEQLQPGRARFASEPWLAPLQLGKTHRQGTWPSANASPRHTKNIRTRANRNPTLERVLHCTKPAWRSMVRRHSGKSKSARDRD